MAENNVIISAEEEAKLLKPIDEYVGKIQAQIDALRVEGSDKVNSLKNQIAIAKENKNLTKEQQNKIIEESKKQLEKAKATEAANKEQITKLIADAEGYLSKHYSSEYYDIVAKSCEAEKKAENSSFEKTKTQIQEEHKKALGSLKDAEEIKAEKYTYKNKLYDAQMAHESRLQEIKDRKHDAFMHKFHLIDLLRMSKYTFAQKQAQKIENYKYTFNMTQFLYKNGLYIVIILIFIALCIITPIVKNTQLFTVTNILNILQQASPRMFLALGVAKLLRVSLSRGKTIISIKDELQHSRSYMNIQLVRYKERFKIDFQIDEELYNYCIVKLVIQPILENAIYYGVGHMDEDDDGRIVVSGEKKDNDIYISIEDNGMGMRKEVLENILTDNNKVPKHGSGVGVINVHSRIKLMFGEGYGLTVYSEPDEGTKVVIHIPAIPYTKENAEKLEMQKYSQRGKAHEKE